MNKKLGIFFLGSALLVGSFLGSYVRRNHTLLHGDPAFSAKRLIDTAGGDQAKLAEASDILRQVILEHPENLSAHFLQGRALQQRGLLDLALQSYQKYFSQSISVDFAANFNAAELYELKGDLENAEKHFTTCIAVAPKEAVGWERLILVLVKEKRMDRAAQYYRSLKETLPNSDVAKRLAPMFPQ